MTELFLSLSRANERAKELFLRGYPVTMWRVQNERTLRWWYEVETH